MRDLALLCAVAFAFIFQCALAHRSGYIDEYRTTNCELEARFYSYHIHVLFWSKNNDSVTAARALQAAFVKRFDVKVSPCPEVVWNTTHSPNYICMFPWAPNADGPFLTGMWAAFIPLERFNDTVPWIMRFRGDLDVFVHPNSGCEIYDHLNWPLWGGNKWEIDWTVMHYNCPGCDQGICANQGSSLMFHNEASECGLSAGKSPTSPFVLKNAGTFCTPRCQKWVSSLEVMNRDCPRMCDNFEGNTQSHDVCEQHLNSLVELAQWQIEQCHIAPPSS